MSIEDYLAGLPTQRRKRVGRLLQLISNIAPPGRGLDEVQDAHFCARGRLDQRGQPEALCLALELFLLKSIITSRLDSLM
jgi:hypothetical protein